jgi:hypothetical protein
MTSLVEIRKALWGYEEERVVKAGSLRQTVRSVTNARQIGQGNKLRAAAHLSGGTAGQTFRGDLSTLSRRELRDANKIWRNQTAAAARNPGFSKGATWPTGAAAKKLEEEAFQRAARARAAGGKPGFKPHPQSQQAKQQRYQQMLTRTTGVPEQHRWGGSR